MLNLLSLLNSLDKNSSVLDLNDRIIQLEDGNKDTFSNIYGGLCSDDGSGVLIEESLETLFEVSGVDILEYKPNYIILKQNGKMYKTDIIEKPEDDDCISLYIDFDSIGEYQ